MLAVPNKSQIEWHERERIMFIHYGPATWQGREYDDHSTPLDQINPKKLDTDQWCEAAVAFGAKELIFVAKHTGGFCFWQTNTSDYGIKETPYKDSKGDVLEEIYNSCKKYNLAFGIYISPSDEHFDSYMGGGGKTRNKDNQEKYSEVYKSQLTEVLEKYPDIVEIWFDGGIVIPVSHIIEKLIPNAMVLQGKELSNIRWCGNEAGKIPYPAYNTLKKEDLITGLTTMAQDDPCGDVWAGIEVDTTLYDHNWFWSKENEKKRKSLDTLMDIYYKSIGRGGVLLINATPNTDGLIPCEDIARYKEVNDEINRRFANPIASISDNKKEIILDLNKETEVNHCILREDYKYGHRVREFTVSALINDTWQELYTGSSIGVKYINAFNTVKTSKLKLEITKCVDLPLIREFSAYNVTDIDLDKLIKSLNEVNHVFDGMIEKCFTVSGDDYNAIKNIKKEFRIDLSKYITQAGQYRISFSSDGDFSISDLIVLLEGYETENLIVKDKEDENGNTFIINRTAVTTGQGDESTILSVNLKVEREGIDSQINAFIKKI